MRVTQPGRPEAAGQCGDHVTAPPRLLPADIDIGLPAAVSPDTDIGMRHQVTVLTSPWWSCPVIFSSTFFTLPINIFE